MSEQTCRNCQIEIKGEIPDGIQEVFICDNCGRYWDEDGNVLDHGFVDDGKPDCMAIAHARREDND